MFKYESIYNEIKNQIHMADLQAGAKLPSILDLSQQFSCSKSTVLTALNKLEDQHLIYAIPKSGYYVVDHQMPHKPFTTDCIDFATSSPTWHAFPYKDFQHCMHKAIDTYQEELFHYGTPNGLPSLINVAKKFLETYQIFTQADNIFVTSGVQQALAILSLMPFPNHRKTILVEQPSYHLYLDFIKAYELPVIGIKRTVEGIDLDELEQIFCSNDIKFFYTMPRFHTPLGTSYSKKEKEAILALADRYDVYIVEDDNLADFDQNPKIDPLFSYDTHNHVIYLKSFSKIMFPGLRIGLAVIPPLLTTKFQRYKKTNDVDSSMISQAALELYIKSGMFKNYRAQIRDTYATRAKILQQALKKYLSAYQTPSEICMHSHIVLPKQVNLNLLINHLRQQKVLLETIDENYLDGVLHGRILKLNISNIEEHKIEEGIKEIAIALNNVKNYF